MKRMILWVYLLLAACQKPYTTTSATATLGVAQETPGTSPQQTAIHPSASPSRSPGDSWCTAGEIELFGCELKASQKHVSLCASDPEAKQGAYRYGSGNTPEVEVTGQLSTPDSKFRRSSYTFAGAKNTAYVLSVTKDQATKYVLWSLTGADTNEQHLVAVRNGTIVFNQDCIKNTFNDNGLDISTSFNTWPEDFEVTRSGLPGF